MMKSILFLCHRLPYPPDKGDKIRAFHVLRELSQRYRVYLGTFIDNTADWQYVERVRSLVAELQVRPLSPYWATLRSSRGLLTGDPLSVPYYRDRALSQWVQETIRREEIRCAYIYSSAMGQFLTPGSVPLSVMDFCDLDSCKWEQYAQTRRWPLSWIYRREAQSLGQVERQLAHGSAWSVFVTQAESDTFKSMVPDLADRIVTVRNGVDTDYFDPALSHEDIPRHEQTVVFTGAMDYWANIDATQWFVSDVWPLIRARHSQARFMIVGSQPAESVKRLTVHPGVVVTGTVPDVRPYLATASVVVAPLRIARGIQNKVLEALAMARPIVATPAALAGLGKQCPASLTCASSPQEFASAVIEKLAQPSSQATDYRGREFVKAYYGWSAALQPLWRLLDGSASPAAALA